MERPDQPTMDQNMEYIRKGMVDVKKYGLETEVIFYALQAMKDNPQITIAQAFNEGCREWDV